MKELENRKFKVPLMKDYHDNSDLYWTDCEDVLLYGEYRWCMVEVEYKPIYSKRRVTGIVTKDRYLHGLPDINCLYAIALHLIECIDEGSHLINIKVYSTVNVAAASALDYRWLPPDERKEQIMDLSDDVSYLYKVKNKINDRYMLLNRYYKYLWYKLNGG